MRATLAETPPRWAILPRVDGWLDQTALEGFQKLLGSYLTWELAAYMFVTGLAFTVRIWDVGARAMHHDESLHATYAWYLFKGQGYQYNPLMHGPLQFYVTAFFYMLFGDTETTARLFAVLCGSGLVFLPYFLRREMGRAAALIAAIALAVSPTFVYYSRFVRDDVYLDFFTLLVMIGMWRYFRNRESGSLYLIAVASALAVACMEAAYIVFYVFFLFFVLVIVAERIGRRRAERVVWETVRS